MAETLALGADVYYNNVPPTEAVGLCVNLLREAMGLPELADHEREMRLQPGVDKQLL